jgi:hypothetical protein
MSLIFFAVAFFISFCTKLKIIFGAAVYEEGVNDMFTCQVNHHHYVNPCGQALDKRMAGSQSPQRELKKRFQILLHPFN